MSVIAAPHLLSASERFWRARAFARARHALARLHARLMTLSGGRIARSFLFTGGMPILVLTTTGRTSGRSRSTPVGFLRDGGNLAIIASNAGSDRPPAWWLNLRSDPRGSVLVDRVHREIRARVADDAEALRLWERFAAQNPGFDEYRSLTTRSIPVVVLEPAPRTVVGTRLR